MQWHIATVHHCLSQQDVVDVPGLVGLAKLDSPYVDIDRKYLKGRIFTERLGFEWDDDNVSFYWDNKGPGSIVPIPISL